MRIKSINYLPSSSDDYIANHRQNYASLALNSKTSKTQRITVIISLLIAIILLAITFTSAIDTSIQNQDIMLCESALKSGNRNYLKKCQCYYDSSDITCIQGGGGQDD